MINKFDYQEMEKNLQEIYSNKDLPSSMFDFSKFDSISKIDKYLSHNLMIGYEFRMFIVKNFGIFGFPTKESIKKLVKYIDGRPVYDLCAGVGYLSYGLSRSDVTVLATDDYSTDYGMDKTRKWFPVDKVNALDIGPSLRNSVAIICWPDYNTGFAHDLTASIHPSNEVLYIGEDRMGCTADNAFFDKFNLEYLDIDWYSFPGIHDRVYRVSL